MPEDHSHDDAVTGADAAPRAALLPVLLEQSLGKLEHDYVMLAILVRIQHLRHGEAMTLIDGLLALGERSPEVLLAKAVVESALDRHEDVLETIRELDRIEPPEVRRGKKIDERIRVRSFMKARALFGLTGELDAEGRASLNFYLRQGGKARPKDR